MFDWVLILSTPNACNSLKTLIAGYTEPYYNNMKHLFKNKFIKCNE